MRAHFELALCYLQTQQNAKSIEPFVNHFSFLVSASATKWSLGTARDAAVTLYNLAQYAHQHSDSDTSQKLLNFSKTLSEVVGDKKTLEKVRELLDQYTAKQSSGSSQVEPKNAKDDDKKKGDIEDEEVSDWDLEFQAPPIKPSSHLPSVQVTSAPQPEPPATNLDKENKFKDSDSGSDWDDEFGAREGSDSEREADAKKSTEKQKKHLSNAPAAKPMFMSLNFAFNPFLSQPKIDINKYKIFTESNIKTIKYVHSLGFP